MPLSFAAVGASPNQAFDLPPVLVGIQPPVAPIPPHPADELLALPSKQRGLRDIKRVTDLFRLVRSLAVLRHRAPGSPTIRSGIFTETAVSILSMVILSRRFPRTDGGRPAVEPLFGSRRGAHHAMHPGKEDRKSTRLNSSHQLISYAV